MLRLLLLLALLPGQVPGQTQAQTRPSPPFAVSTLRTTPVMALLTPDKVLELMDAGRLSEAERAARAAAQARPDSARARVVLARILARQERWAEARQVLAQAQALPQWQEESISVPYESPNQLDRVMQRDPEAALGPIADVLLAEGDDPKAYYLQALALVQLNQYDRARAALDRARTLEPGLEFAHPDTLRQLEALLRDRPSTSAASTLAGPGLETQESSSWWLVAVLLLVPVVGMVLWVPFWRTLIGRLRAETQAKAERKRAIQEAHTQLDRAIHDTQQALAAAPTPELRRRLERLHRVRQQVRSWERGRRSSTDITQQFGLSLMALQSDVSWQQHQVVLDQQAAEDARAEAERQSSSDGSSSFSSGGGDSWSSGNSGSSDGNNGGSSW